MKDYTRKNVRNRKRRIERRLRNRNWKDQRKPMLTASNISYEMGNRIRGVSVGGIGMMHLVAKRTDLIEAIEEDRQPECNVYEARTTIEMIAGVFESHRVGGPVRLPLKTRKNPLTLL